MGARCVPPCHGARDIVQDSQSTYDAEAQLLAAFCQGDRAAARELTQTYGPRAYAQAYRRVGHQGEAEDIAQEAMLRLWNIAPNWKTGEARISTWLYRVVDNLATDLMRKKSRATTDIDDIAEPASEDPSSAAQVMQRHRLEALNQALETLPEAQRHAFELRHLEGHSNPDIAHHMGQSVRGVESLIARAKRSITALLAPRKNELGYSYDDAEL